jgi:hypothetical protein
MAGKFLLCILIRRVAFEVTMIFQEAKFQVGLDFLVFMFIFMFLSIGLSRRSQSITRIQ